VSCVADQAAAVLQDFHLAGFADAAVIGELVTHDAATDPSVTFTA
jgi:hypothetical protein